MHDALRDAINVIGVAVYSAKDPSLKILTDLFEAEGAKPRASVWAAGVKTSLQNAALANGYLAHLEDFDDTHFPTVLHPSAPTVPAAFAIAPGLLHDGDNVFDIGHTADSPLTVNWCEIRIESADIGG